MGIVVCKLPNAGLGNQLFPLMKAYVFARMNRLPLMIVNYHQLKVGPWLRGEKNKRIYRGFFVFEKSIPHEIFDKWKIYRLLKKGAIEEPEIKEIPKEDVAGSSFLFNKIPHYSRRFEGLKEYREIVIKLLQQIILPSNKSKIDQVPPPCIGVHFRMGDFRKLEAGEEFGKAGTVRTPEQYFIATINDIRSANGTCLPVNIFTDGLKKDVPRLCQLPNVFFVEGNNDLVDLILLSKSKIIITSASSTFSYWAGFLSDAAIIVHPLYLDFKVRPESVNEKFYEGAFDKTNEHLMRIIKSIKM